MSDLYCPYCDAGLEVCHDDGFGYEEGVAHEMCCKECSELPLGKTQRLQS